MKRLQVWLNWLVYNLIIKILKKDYYMAIKNDKQSISLHFKFTTLLLYPFRKQGKYIIITAALLMGVISLFRMITNHIPYIGRLISMFTGIICCIIPAYFVEVLTHTASGDEEPPDWPQIADWRKDLIRPACLLLIAAATSFFPTLVWWIAGRYGLVPKQIAVLILLGSLGMFYLPMAILATVLFDGFHGLSPLIVAPAILKTLPEYGLVVILFLGLLGMFFVGGIIIPQIPILRSMLAGVVFMYCLTIQARILGVLYWKYASRIGWFD